MPEFDFLIFADWPRGLYLAQKLALKDQKLAYVECLPRLKNPFGLFLNENDKRQRKFFENLGFLSQQEGGFCLLNPEGVWPLQDMKIVKKRQTPIQNFSCSFTEEAPPSFKNNWLSYLSLNLSAKVFKDNNSIFTNKGLDLLTDYFLFEFSAQKIEEFKKRHSNISFFTAQEKTISFKRQQNTLSLKNKTLTAKKMYCLNSPDRISTELKLDKTCWQWQACYLTANFEGYKEIIPSHFLFLKNIFFPWCYDNLLSVFHRQGVLEVWMRLKPEENSMRFAKQAEKHLKNFFKTDNLHLINKAITKGFKVYGEASLNSISPKTRAYIENCTDFFHGDLASEIHNEQRLYELI